RKTSPERDLRRLNREPGLRVLRLEVRSMLRSASLSVFVLAAACATTGSNRPQLGTIHLRPYTAPGASPAVFSVQQGRILSPDLDVVAEADGCLRGHTGNSPVELCPAKGTPPPEKPGDK